MAKDPDNSGPARYAPAPVEDRDLLVRELRRRGMTEAQIEMALRKKKRSRILEVVAVKHPRALRSGKLKITPAIPPSDSAQGGRVLRAPMTQQVCTVSFAADLLKVHQKTVLRYIREGALPATRVGKSWRIARADLEAFAGVPPQDETAAQDAWITSIVDIPGVGPELARKWAITVTSALDGKPRGAGAMRADVVYEAEREHLKIIVVGPPSDTVNLLALIRVWMEQLTA